MTQTSMQRAALGLAYWKKRAKALEKENRELIIERDLWKEKALALLDEQARRRNQPNG